MPESKFGIRGHFVLLLSQVSPIDGFIFLSETFNPLICFSLISFWSHFEHATFQFKAEKRAIFCIFLYGLRSRPPVAPGNFFLIHHPSNNKPLVRHYKASLRLWRQRSKQTAENKSRCWCLTASIIALLGDLGSVSGWKNLWDMCWGCWMVFDISQCCLGSESGRLES